MQDCARRWRAVRKTGRLDPVHALTGMTWDGLFWIEAGEVRHGLRNMRFNESPLDCRQRLTALGRPERVLDGSAAHVPPDAD